MDTPIHSINLDFTHSSEAKALLEVLSERPLPANSLEEDNYLCGITLQVEEAVELLESLEM